MAQNGDIEPMEQGDAATEAMETEERTEDYQKLVDYGISEKVASELDKIYRSGEYDQSLNHLLFERKNAW